MDEINKLSQSIVKKESADIILFNADIHRRSVKKIISLIKERENLNENVILILVTSGGDPDAAYQLARYLQRKYKYFHLLVPGYCKSAGTLIALGAHNLIMCNQAELGPLDVQMRKQDNLWERQSGLTVMSALEALHTKSSEYFDKIFIETQQKSNGAIHLKTAAEIATKLTTGLYSQLFASIDPMHVGEATRATLIAYHYGKRLQRVSNNFSDEALNHLIVGYPAHGFLIDREECESLFYNVRELTDDEMALITCLGEQTRVPSTNQKIAFLNKVSIGAGNRKGDENGQKEADKARSERASKRAVSNSETSGKTRTKGSTRKKGSGKK